MKSTSLINLSRKGIDLYVMDKTVLFCKSKNCTVKLGNKERFDKEQIGIKELIMDYQPFYTINLLLDKELLPI